ncbi:EF-hand domain-containing protein [Thalassoglobus polymorphus]|uniref:EF hand n=1 Tax=Thalassoglobus polymorphus TaxID=2527994 RepID=A0A517QJC9_9PLAN|nr:hypothetical protein [Thalassoglobus polymorphus]QDT31736.1 EF hand [Thalassoglobus polymorphus]
MKRISLTLAVLMTCTISGLAQPPGGGRGGPPPGYRGQQQDGGQRGERGGSPNAVMAALDADGDQTISAEEILSAAAALNALDQNGDGKLTSDEVQACDGPGGRAGQSGLSQSGSSSRSSQEGSPSTEQFLTHAFTFDADEDEMLNKSELTKMAAALIKEMQSRGGPPGGGRGRR